MALFEKKSDGKMCAADHSAKAASLTKQAKSAPPGFIAGKVHRQAADAHFAAADAHKAEGNPEKAKEHQDKAEEHKAAAGKAAPASSKKQPPPFAKLNLK
jgi:hypothetical protein